MAWEYYDWIRLWLALQHYQVLQMRKQENKREYLVASVDLKGKKVEK